MGPSYATRAGESDLAHVRHPERMVCYDAPASFVARPLESSRINQYTRIEQPLGIKRAFHRPQRRGKEFWTLLVIPAAMVAPDRVMMRNRPTRFHKCIGSGAFYRPELFDQRRLVAQGAKGKVDGWSAWVDVGKTAADHSFLPGRLSYCSSCCFLD